MSAYQTALFEGHCLHSCTATQRCCVPQRQTSSAPPEYILQHAKHFCVYAFATTMTQECYMYQRCPARTWSCDHEQQMLCSASACFECSTAASNTTCVTTPGSNIVDSVCICSKHMLPNYTLEADTCSTITHTTSKSTGSLLRHKLSQRGTLDCYEAAVHIRASVQLGTGAWMNHVTVRTLSAQKPCCRYCTHGGSARSTAHALNNRVCALSE
jgi:hypothetical protein